MCVLLCVRKEGLGAALFLFNVGESFEYATKRARLVAPARRLVRAAG
jgi:hypothetical protein